jgi:16S rRNA (cytidine1402-2'-O)-methyltransferase
MMAGTIYLVATPIGNLEDITRRATRILEQADLIACEDTRQTRKLLEYLGIDKPLTVYEEHTERERAEALIQRVQRGESVALVSDAGTPLVSDPGYRLVEKAVSAGIRVQPIPGPCAALAALAASGLPTDAFYFGGFLPPKTTQRRNTLVSVKNLAATLIFFEAPHRILDALSDIATVLGARPVVLARELTKVHEEFLRGQADEVKAQLTARPSIKGEFTILIGKAEGPEESEVPLKHAVEEWESKGFSRMEAIKIVARQRRLPKREVYRAVEAAED